MSFPARYPGRCASCEERIHEGDPIRMTGDRAVHDDCSEQSAQEWVSALLTPSITSCPVCWLVHPEGACDR